MKKTPAKRPTKKKVTKPATKYRQRVLIEWIQDRSGSMRATWTEDLNGFKVFVQDLLKDDSVDQYLSLTCFDTVVERPLSCVPLAEVKPEILAEYGPRGGTALYDALGTALKSIEARESDFDKIIVVVVTDGEENSSRSFTKTALNGMVDGRLQTNKYTFTYLGTQPETWGDAQSLGVSAGNSVKMSASGLHRGSTYAVTAASLNAFKSSEFTMTRSLYADYGDKAVMGSINMCVADDTPSDKK